MISFSFLFFVTTVECTYYKLLPSLPAWWLGCCSILCPRVVQWLFYVDRWCYGFTLYWEHQIHSFVFWESFSFPFDRIIGRERSGTIQNCEMWKVNFPGIFDILSIRLKIWKREWKGATRRCYDIRKWRVSQKKALELCFASIAGLPPTISVSRSSLRSKTE
jgi:hypothetical protein